MNAGELRAALNGLPDDTEIVVHPGDGDYHELHIERRLPPVLDNPWTLTLVEGQPVTLDLDLDARTEAGTGHWW